MWIMEVVDRSTVGVIKKEKKEKTNPSAPAINLAGLEQYVK